MEFSLCPLSVSLFVKSCCFWVVLLTVTLEGCRSSTSVLFPLLKLGFFWSLLFLDILYFFSGCVFFLVFFFLLFFLFGALFPDTLFLRLGILSIYSTNAL